MLGGISGRGRCCVWVGGGALGALAGRIRIL